MDTKEKILNVSEILFADKGFESVSVREIVKEADVNIAAINYHFGSKEDLILAVMERRIKIVNQKRLSELEKLRSKYQAEIPLKEILKAFIGPAFLLGKEDQKSGSKFMMLMGRVTSNANPELKQKVINLFDQVVQEFLPEIIKSTDAVDPHVVACRFYFSIGSMAHVLMNQTVPRKLANSLGGSVNLEELEEELISFLSGGINA